MNTGCYHNNDGNDGDDDVRMRRKQSTASSVGFKRHCLSSLTQPQMPCVLCS